MSRTDKQRRPVVLLRPAPGDSPIHRMWAGTKLLAVFIFSVLLTFFPSWASITLVAVAVGVAIRMAGVPRGAVPSIPRFLWVLIGIGAFTAALGGGDPVLSLFGLDVALGGLLTFTRITFLAVVLLALSMMVSWTTNVADIAPAIATLGRPLRLLRIPVDEWAVTTALTLRSFPMLLDEFRVLLAARKLRPHPQSLTRRKRIRQAFFELTDLLAAATTAALRRADEMGDAITARGGAGQITASHAGPAARDWIALSVVAVVCVASVLLF